MVFWLAVLVGGLFAWIGVRIGFYATWIMLFNLALSAYVAIFLTPVIITDVPDATGVAYGHAMTLLTVAVATLAIAYGTCFAVLSGQLRMEFPKVFDNTGAGVLGFFTGFLVCSFVGFAFCLTPVSKNDFCKVLGLDSRSQATNTSYLCWWCNRLHSFAATSGVDMTSRQSVDKLLKQAGTAPEAQTKSGSLMAPPNPQAVLPPAPPSPPTNEPVKSEPGKTESEKTPTKTTPDSEGMKKDDAKAQPLDEELSRRRAIIDSPAAVQAAVTDPKISIIEVADKCVAGQFDADHTGLLQDWVSKGGVLWVRNNVLTLFGIRYSRIPPSGDSLTCVVSARAEVASLAVGCRKVVLKDAGGMAAIGPSKTALPLLVTETSAFERDKVATPRWSMVAFGKGWISDPKPIDMAQDDGAIFWQNFCRLCLKKELLDAIPRTPPPGPEEQPAPPAAVQPSLSGNWRTSTGAVLRLEDDGKTVTIDLVAPNDVIQVLIGRLTRRDDDGESGEVSFTGTLDAVFVVDAPKQHVVNATVTTSDSRRLQLRSPNWPRWSNKGKFLGKFPATDVLTRSDAAPPNPVQPDNPFTIPSLQ